MTLHHLSLGTVALEAGTYRRRSRLNRDYLRRLDPGHLVRNHLLEAGIGDQAWHLKPSSSLDRDRGLDRHWGWETPGSLLRGHFLGHWMSAAAREIAATGDPFLRAALDSVVTDLARCQEENGGEWVFAIPPTFLRRLAEGREVWAPQYAIHKTFMGLLDVWRDLGDRRALEIAHRAAAYFLRWARGFDADEFERILEVETGGMLEAWADLLAATGDEMYRELLERYYHRTLFDALLAGRDALTNMHANTTIPEVLGAARAYEVTGEQKWRDIVEAYWEWAVERRGTFCTGGQTSGEIWTPPFSFAARRGEKTQEHCTVYNMIRLADVRFRWTGEAALLDYIERNLLNGILAQQHAETGQVAYFLPLRGGSRKAWGSETEDFWCCHGSLVQAHTRHSALVFYRDDDDSVTIAQFIASSAAVDTASGPVAIGVEVLDDDAKYVGPDANASDASDAGEAHRPASVRVRVAAASAEGVGLRLRVRVPRWTLGEPAVAGDTPARREGDWLVVDHPGGVSRIDLAFGTRLVTVPIPDDPATVAFMEGPVVLAGLADREIALAGSAERPADILSPDDERHWSQWRIGYRSVGQPVATRFVPLHQVTDEPFSVYFPLRPSLTP